MEKELSNQSQQRINLVLTIEETNLILEGLGQLPFFRVHQLITNIQQQAALQLQNGPTDTTGS